MKALLIVIALTAPASADRTPFFTFGGLLAGRPTATDQITPAGGPFVIASYEHPHPAMPVTPGVVFDVTIVPELFVGNASDGSIVLEPIAGVGSRFELRMAQREQGAMKMSARIGIFLAARALIVGVDRDPRAELGLGEYVWLGDNVRLFGDFGLTISHRDREMAREADVVYHPTAVGLYVTAGLGFSL